MSLAATRMAETDQGVQTASRVLDEMGDSMRAISESGGRISRIIKVIDEIAFQTNILALNAAVEAARAGAAGMGFAVVADEVRNLAHRSADAARETAALIEESIARSHEGDRRLETVNDAVRSITTSSAEVKTLIDAVNSGVQEQASGVKQIVQSIHQMQRTTQENAAAAQEGAAAGAEMSAQSASMKDVALQLLEVVRGRRNADESQSGDGHVPSAPNAD